ncbi:prophage antirepressor [Klebsiella phage Kpn74]|uniref:Prophage antirepressor n=1 Tax=Klebsiella phage Kpn74 TaxID=3044026 RepID=A0AAT9V553_9CAUD|nr:prophage antirepressor [Klebsiella phage Kpn74]
MNALSVFSFQENHPVRVVLVNGEPGLLLLMSAKRSISLITVLQCVNWMMMKRVGTHYPPWWCSL